MPCTNKNARDFCQIFRHYIAVGNDKYHGELCSCLWWTDNTEDAKVKSQYEANSRGARVSHLTNKRHLAHSRDSFFGGRYESRYL
jgi:hypothetical protein